MTEQIDIAIVAVYIIAMLAWGIYVGIQQDTDDFLVFSRKAPFILVLFSLISTWVGSGTTVATAASGYSTGLSLGLTAGVGGIVGVISAAIFAPRLKKFGDQYQAHTLADFFSIRYSSRSRLLTAVFITAVYLLITAAQLVGLVAIIEVVTGAQFSAVIWLAGISTVLYTAVAGIEADFYTDVVHFIIMSIVLIMLTSLVLFDIGGITGLRELPANYFDPFAYGGISFFIAGIVFGAASVFVAMELWQRIYAATDESSAKQALLLGAGGIILFYAASTFLGMAAQVISLGVSDQDFVLFVLMIEFLPTGLLGLGIAGFVAVFVSTINSTLMVASATLTKDLYGGWLRPSHSKDDLLRVARLLTLLFGIISILVAFVVRDLVTLSVSGLLMLLILFPSIIGGFYWSKATAQAAELSIVFGVIVMIAFLFVTPSMAFVPGFVVSSVVFVAISLLGSHAESEQKVTLPDD